MTTPPPKAVIPLTREETPTVYTICGDRFVSELALADERDALRKELDEAVRLVDSINNTCSNLTTDNRVLVRRRNEETARAETALAQVASLRGALETIASEDRWTQLSKRDGSPQNVIGKFAKIARAALAGAPEGEKTNAN